MSRARIINKINKTAENPPHLKKQLPFDSSKKSPGTIKAGRAWTRSRLQSRNFTKNGTDSNRVDRRVAFHIKEKEGTDFSLTPDKFIATPLPGTQVQVVALAFSAIHFE